MHLCQKMSSSNSVAVFRLKEDRRWQWKVRGRSSEGHKEKISLMKEWLPSDESKTSQRRESRRSFMFTSAISTQLPRKWHQTLLLSEVVECLWIFLYPSSVFLFSWLFSIDFHQHCPLWQYYFTIYSTQASLFLNNCAYIIKALSSSLLQSPTHT